MRFEWDDELLAAGHRAGLAALGRGGEAAEFTARFAREKLPALRAPGAAGRLDYGAELRDLLGPSTTRSSIASSTPSTPRGGRPARSSTARTRCSTRCAAAACGSRSSRTRGRSPPRLVRRELDELGVAARVDAIVLSGEVGARKPEPAIFERALAELGVDADGGALRRRPPRRRRRGRRRGRDDDGAGALVPGRRQRRRRSSRTSSRSLRSTS